MAHKWTNEENEYIKNNYKTVSKKELCKKFDVSMASINHKFQRLGITEKSIMGMSYEWSDSDIKYLIDNWLNKEDSEIWKELGIDKLGFGKYVVTRKRIALGLVGKSKRVRKNKEGYKYYINYDKTVYTHRKNMEEKIGRKLLSGEIVHHIDGNKSNDDIDNLFLCKDNSEHQHLHNSLECIAYQLVQNGTIKFNYETGEYYL